MGRGVYTLQPKPHAPLRTLIGSIIDDRQFLSFLSSILTLDPQKRPSSARGIAAPVARAEPRRGGGASRRVAVTARRAIAFVHGRRPRRLRLVPLRQRLHV